VGGVSTRLLSGFDDPRCDGETWDRLLRGTDHIYLTREFQLAWWRTLGRGRLLLIVAERDGRPVALAPFYTDEGMVFFVGSAFDSDYLDFIGEVESPAVLDALLDTARHQVPGFLGFRLYFVSEATGTGSRLQAAAGRLGLDCYREDDMQAAQMDLAADPEQARAAANRKKLRRVQRLFEQQAPLEVLHLRDGSRILPQLDAFFEQHVARWADTETPSRFVDEGPRELVREFTRQAADTGWLRFCRIDWRGRPVAFHYGYCLRGRTFWGMPSFDPEVASMSPGQLMLRQLLLAAIEEGARVFDFGTGTQPFKLRFASHVVPVHTWGLYPPGEEGSS
jgi:CelD/BcsL family acetyltransferase involved in cellulose biosynthesis